MCLRRIVWVLPSACIWFCAGNVVAQELAKPAKDRSYRSALDAKIRASEVFATAIIDQMR